MTFVIAAVGFLGFIYACQMVMLARAIRGLRFKIPHCSLISFDEFPSDARSLLTAASAELSRLDFCYSHCQRCDGPLDEAGYSEVYAQVYISPDRNVSASLSPHPFPDTENIYRLEFFTRFPDGHLLITANKTSLRMIGDFPETTLDEGIFAAIDAQYSAHLENTVREEQRHGVSMSALMPADFVAEETKRLGEYVGYLQSARQIIPAENVHFKTNLIFALRSAARMLIDSARASSLGEKTPIVPESIPSKLEVDGFRRLKAFRNSYPLSSAGKITALLFSLLFFALSFGFFFSPLIVALLTIVLLIHEGGHIIGMKLFGYKNLNMLFLPFLGAVALGEKNDTTLYQRGTVYLLGPLPGIALGTALMSYGSSHELPEIAAAGSMFFALNYINLLPVMPLDGGQVVNAALFSRFPTLESAFCMGGAAAVGISGYFFATPLLCIIGIFLLINFTGHRTKRQIFLRFKSQLADCGQQPNEEKMIAVAFELLKKSKLARLPFAKKYEMVNEFQKQALAPLPNLAQTACLSFVYVALLLFSPLVYGHTSGMPVEHLNQSFEKALLEDRIEDAHAIAKQAVWYAALPLVPDYPHGVIASQNLALVENIALENNSVENSTDENIAADLPIATKVHF